MPIYRKRKFAGGGRTSSILNNPGLGLGLQYIPTQQELPDVEGAMFVEQSKQQALAQLEALRKERTPDVSELTKKLDELEMFGGVRESLKSRISNRLASYMQQMNQDPDFAFSPEARQEFNALKSEIDAGRFTYHHQRYKESKGDWEAALAKGLGEEFYVSNGMVPVVSRDNPDDIKMIPFYKLNSFLQSPENAGNYFVYGQSKDLWNHLHNNVSERFTNLPTFSSRVTLRDAKDEIDKVFKNVAHSKMGNIDFSDIADKSGVAVFRQLESSLKNNYVQISAAVQQTMNSLSQQSRDALLSHYMLTTDNPTEAGFNKFFTDFLQGEAEIRALSEEDVNERNNIISGEVLQRIGSTEPPALLRVNATARMRDGLLLWDGGSKEMLEVPIWYKSAEPYDSEREFKYRTFQDVYFYNKDAKSSKEDGDLIRNPKTFYGVKKEGDFILPITTGQTYKLKVVDGVQTYVPDQFENNLVDRMITHAVTARFFGKGNVDQIEEVEFEVDGQLKKGYATSDGKILEVRPIAFEKFRAYNDKDSRDADYLTHVFKPLDRISTTQKFGVSEWSLEYKEENYFDKRTLRLNKEGKEIMKGVLGALNTHKEQLNAIEPKTEDEKRRLLEAKKQFAENSNIIINHYENVIDPGSVPGFDINESLNYINKTINSYANVAEVDKVLKSRTFINNTIKASKTLNNIN
ncbi:hypothetical protein [Mongoliitalea daihaiensis]|uniref:hypothetical protein n=1 Tax=Mongoliitalea daihaiensis TaxID=2782006 RepID=UPI001F2345D4|nr:hypothetical protein [Mongoliitalea daihaiensis]UJP63992.1 hypothetical protein IPZ59_14335 [Mongoliitalea daihaiensis]